MRCENCLTAGAGEARFCSTCGRSLATTTSIDAGAPPTSEPGARAGTAFEETVRLVRRQCESCGAPTFGERKLCEACDSTFGNVLRRESGTHEVAPPVDPVATPHATDATSIFGVPVSPAALDADAPREDSTVAATVVRDDAESFETLPIGAMPPVPGEALTREADAVSFEAQAWMAPVVDAAIDAPPLPHAPVVSAAEETTCLAPATHEESTSFVADADYEPHVPIVARAPWEAPVPEPADVAAPFVTPDPTLGSPVGAGPGSVPWWERHNQAPTAVPPIPRPAPARFTASGSYRLPPPQFERIPTPPPPTRAAAPPIVPLRPAPPRRLGLGVSTGLVVLFLVGVPLVWWSPWSGSADHAGDVDAQTDLQAQAAPPPAPIPVRVKRATGPSKPAPASDAARKAAALRTPPSKPRRPPQAGKTPPAVEVPREPVAVVAAPPAGIMTALDAPAPPAPPPPVPLEPVPSGPVFEVAQVDVRPQITSRVEPRRPDHLSGRRVEDVVILRVLVAPSGRLSDVRVLRGSRVDGALDAAAVSAVRRWSFAPARRKGQAVSCWYNVGLPLRFDGN